MAEALKEVYLGENNLEKMRKASKGAAQTLKMKDGNLKMDSFTASAIMQIYDKINDKNKKTFEKMMKDGKKADIMKLQKFAMSKISSEYVPEEFEEEFELDEAKYDLYHKDFSSAMQHAYAMAKKLYGITIDPKEIDDKVATGPKKPGSGKTNSYRLKGDKGAIQVQVYNKGGSKPFELNMYKEEVKLQEKPADFIRLTFNSPADVKKAKKWMDQNLPGADQGFTFMDASGKDIDFENVDDAEDLMAKLKKAGFKFKVDYREEVELDESKKALKAKSEKSGVSVGILSKVYDRGMAAYKTGHRPGSTPQQWALARVNSFLTGGGARKADNDLWQQAKKQKKEDLDEILTQRPRAGGGRHGKNVEMNLKVHSIIMQDYIKQGASKDKASKAAFKDVKAMGNREKQDIIKKGKSSLFYTESFDLAEDGHTDVSSAVRQCKTVMEDANQILSKLMAMNPEDSLPTWWSNKLAIASNSMNKMRDYLLVPSEMKEQLEEAKGDLEDLKNVVAELEKASKMHLDQSKRVQAHVDMMLAAESVNEQPEHEITVGGYTTKFFYMCGTAQEVMKKNADVEGAEEITKLQDDFMKLEKDVMDAGSATDGQKILAKEIYNKIMKLAGEAGLADDIGGYMKQHLDSVEKGDPKPGFGRTDMKEAIDPADVDDDATELDVKAADKNIMMQMRKVISLRGNFKVEFGDKKKMKLPPKIAQAVQKKYNSIRRPADKQKFTIRISKSYKDMLDALNEGFASDAQRRAAFAQGYKAKGKKGKKEETKLSSIHRQLREK